MFAGYKNTKAITLVCITQNKQKALYKTKDSQKNHKGMMFDNHKNKFLKIQQS
jgi:hypothetical protein